MIVITSAAYVGSELQSECGRLPPSMLPLGNRRLFEHQVTALRGAFPGRPIHLSLPDDFEIEPRDRRSLDRLGIEIVPVPEGLPLAASLIYVLNSIAAEEGDVGVLHGDTLIDAFPTGADVIGVVRTGDDYDWEVERIGDADELVWCGWFHFSSGRELLRSLTASRGRFVDALHRYDEKRSLDRVEIAGWHDLGHANTYFKTRASRTTERAFNSLAIDDGCLVKSGQQPRKIAAETAWFAALPPSLRRFAPQLIDHGQRADGRPFYTLEYLCLLPLNELFVHGRNPVFFWDRLFHHCARFLDRCRAARAITGAEAETVAVATRGMVADKTRARLDQFAGARGISLDQPVSLNGAAYPPLRAIADRAIEAVLAGRPIPSFVHGDFCLSNILFDARGETIKVIDPRGLDQQDNLTQLGDLRYDLAKLCHSVIGAYDLIIAGAYDLERRGPLDLWLSLQIDPRIEEIQASFRRHRFLPEVSVEDVMPLTILLFLSMLPLHADNPDRQDALLANAVRLYGLHFTEDRPCS